MKTRSVRIEALDLERANQLDINISDCCRSAIKKSIHARASFLPISSISFTKKCSCGSVVTEKTGVSIKMNELGVWFDCPSCGSSGLNGTYKINYKK